MPRTKLTLKFARSTVSPVVTITYRPWSELVIHEIIENSPDELYSFVVRQTLAMGGAGIIPSINWAEGVAFAVGPMPDNDELVKDKLKGIVHYGLVQFAQVPDYRDEARVFVGGVAHVVRLQKNDKNPIFVELARYLKSGQYKH